MTCPVCAEDVQPHERFCVGCQTDCGFPNVRAATAERQALADRVADAEAQAVANGTSEILEKLKTAVKSSQAARARSLDEVYGLVKADNKLIGTFHDLKGAGLLRPSATAMEAARQSAEPLVFLNYHEKIQFAALTLNDEGLFNYGNCVMVFREASIAARATVFEENCVLFCQRRNIGPANPVVPTGHRATWDQRHDLAVAKLGPRLRSGMTDSDLAPLLLMSGGEAAKDEFIEIHIYERLHRSALNSELLWWRPSRLRI
jgi:hypothetical protein